MICYPFSVDTEIVPFLSYSFLIQTYALHVSAFCLILSPENGVNIDGGIAQLVEHLPCKQGVIGSNPFTSTTHGLIAQQVRAHA